MENYVRFGTEKSTIEGNGNCERKHNLYIQLRITSGWWGERDESSEHVILVFCLASQPIQRIRQETLPTDIDKFTSHG